jgi:hypothetical protein
MVVNHVWTVKHPRLLSSSAAEVRFSLVLQPFSLNLEPDHGFGLGQKVEPWTEHQRTGSGGFSSGSERVRTTEPSKIFFPFSGDAHNIEIIDATKAHMRGIENMVYEL